MDASVLKPVEIFYSYAHEDEKYRDELENHLKILLRKGIIAGWKDREISAGREWDQQIDERLNRASVILLLVSSDFLASDYCNDVEVKRALARHDAKEARVIPIILRACDWENTEFARLQVVPKDGLPVSKWPDKDSAFLSVEQEILKVVKEVNQTVIECYANFIKRWGVYEGIGQPLSDEAIRRRQSTRRFYRRSGLIEKVQVINGHGHLAGGIDLRHRTDLARQGAAAALAECQWEFVRGPDLTLSYEWARDQANRPVYGLHYPPSADLQSVKGHYIDESGFALALTDTGAATVKYTRSSDGFDKEVCYFDSGGKPVAGDQGSYGESREFDQRGLTARVTNLGFDGQPAWRNDGYAKFAFEYDAGGNCTRSECLDLEGKPTPHSDRYSAFTSTFDSWGNLTVQEYLDEAGAPILTKDGFAKWTADYDEWGNQTKVRVFDAAGKPTRLAEGFFEYSAQFDDFGKLTEAVYKDESGNLVCTREGYARWTAAYDQWGNQEKLCYFDDQNNRVRICDGFAEVQYIFDNNGRATKTIYFDEAGNRTRNRDGVSAIDAQYDDYGHEVHEAYLDELDHPVRHKEGYASWTERYVEGRAVEWECFDEAGAPVKNSDGYTTRTRRHNEQGKIVEEFYFDESVPAAGEPSTVVAAPAQNFKVAYFSLERKRALHRGGYTGWTARYNERGNQIEVTYLGKDGQPALLSDGFAAWTAQYDERGRQKENTYLDAAGKPATIKAGYVRWQAQYDKFGNRVRQTFLDEAGRPVRKSDGVITIVSEYDCRGNETAISYADETGSPMRHKDGFLKCIRAYDPWGRIVVRIFEGFDPARGFTQVEEKYDDRGNILERCYFDDQHRPARGEDSVFQWTATYDTCGRRVTQIFLDENGQSARNRHGYTRFEAKYEDGKPAERIYRGYDPSGGFIERSVLFEPDKNASTERRFGADGRTVSTITTISDDRGNHLVIKYDDTGKIVEAACFAENDQRALHEDGWSRMLVAYGPGNSQPSVTYFGKDDEPIVPPAATHIDAPAPVNGAAQAVAGSVAAAPIAASKPALQFSVMCLNVPDDNAPPTLQYLFYELPFPELPARMPAFYVINCWVGAQGHFRQSVKIYGPNETRLLVDTGEQTVALSDSAVPFMVVNRLTETTFSEPGCYWIHNYLDGELVLRYPLLVRKAETRVRIPLPAEARPALTPLIS